MKRKIESVQAKPPSQKLEFAVGEMADEAKRRAVDVAAKVISEKILDHIDKDASIRKMRRDSIAKAREVLADNRHKEKVQIKAKPKRQAKPKITTEMAAIKPSGRRKKDQGEATPPAEALRGSRAVADV